MVDQEVRHLGARPEECYFWATHAGDELDLLVVRGRKRFGFEIKRTSAPKDTPSMRHALADLKLAQLDVIYAGEHSFPMADGIRAVALGRPLDGIDPLWWWPLMRGGRSMPRARSALECADSVSADAAVYGGGHGRLRQRWFYDLGRVDYADRSDERASFFQIVVRNAAVVWFGADNRVYGVQEFGRLGQPSLPETVTNQTGAGEMLSVPFNTFSNAAFYRVDVHLP